MKKYRIWYRGSYDMGITWVAMHKEIEAYTASDAVRFCGIWSKLILKVDLI